MAPSPCPPPSWRANWPSDELWLAVNPGTEDGLTLPPDAVQSLPIYADRSWPDRPEQHDRPTPE